MPRTCNVDEAEILQLWNDGMSINAIREELSCGWRTVRDRLVKNGVHKTRRRYDGGSWTKAQDQMLIDARNAGLTGSDMYAEVQDKTNSACQYRLLKLRHAGLVR